MGWLNPWLLLGLAALAVPVWVHLVRRENPLSRPFPSLMFLRRLPYPLRQRRTLRDRGLLALRCLALALLVLGFTAPYCARDQAAVMGGEPLPEVVLLVDGSYSVSPPARWEAVVQAARARIDQLQSGQRAALIMFDDSARLVEDLTGDHARLRASLAALRPGDGGTRFEAGFSAAARLLTDSRSPAATVVLISDLQASGLNASDSLPLADNTALDIVPITEPVGPNVAIMGAEQRGQTLAVRLRNTGTAPLTDGYLRLSLDGRLAEERALALEPGEECLIELPLTLARDRATAVLIEAGPDELTADNRQQRVLTAGRGLNVTLVEPDRARPHQSVYLEQALRLARTPVTLTRLKAAALDPETLADTDVVILDDAPLPRGTAGASLQRFIADGGGLLLVAGETVEPPWPDYLPGTFGPPQTGSALGIDVGGGHPLAVTAGLRTGTAFAGTQVMIYREFQPTTAADVISRLSDGSPLLIAGQHGSGQVLVLTTTADPRWSTLALEPGFVPLTHAALDFLAGRTPPVTAVTLGDTLDLAQYSGTLPGMAHWRAYLDSGGTAVLETPAGNEQRLPAGQHFYTPRTVGLFTAHRADGADGDLPFAVNPPHAESLLTALEPAALAARTVQRPPAAHNPSSPSTATPAQRLELGHYLLMLAGLLLVLENVLANRLSARRPSLRGSS